MQDDLYKTSLKTLKYKNKKEKLFFETSSLLNFFNKCLFLFLSKELTKEKISFKSTEI